MNAAGRARARGRRVARTATTLLLAAGATACGLGLERATAERIATVEASWKASPVLDYRITVDVQRPEERRRNLITVRDGRIMEASVSYWDADGRRWGDAAALREEQASPFTPRGLFDFLRQELAAGRRREILVSFGGTPPFPRRIVLGARRRGERDVPGSEATIIVRRFEIADGADP